MRKLLPLVVASFSFTAVWAQSSNQEQAIAKKNEAIELMDNGKLAESITLLNEARKLDPTQMDIVYELALAKYQQKEFDDAIKDLKYLIRQNAANGRVYAMMGNVQDDMGKPEKAIDTYDEGLKKFPKEGALYVERGVMELKKGNNDAGLKFFEDGIKNAPMHSSNYYRAAKHFLDSKNEVWGMIYGEIFMNLERGSKRTEEISKLLYYTYKGEIKFESDTAASVSFASNNIELRYDPSKKKKGDTDLAMMLLSSIGGLSYGGAVYEKTLAMAVIGEKAINVASLHRIRTKFLEQYFAAGYDTTYNVVLFEFQKKVKDAGHFEAYNYWVLGQGDENVLSEWVGDHKQQWDDFIKWFKENRIQITDEKSFSRIGLTVSGALKKDSE